MRLVLKKRKRKREGEKERFLVTVMWGKLVVGGGAGRRKDRICVCLFQLTYEL